MCSHTEDMGATVHSKRVVQPMTGRMVRLLDSQQALLPSCLSAWAQTGAHAMRMLEECFESVVEMTSDWNGVVEGG